MKLAFYKDIPIKEEDISIFPNDIVSKIDPMKRNSVNNYKKIHRKIAGQVLKIMKALSLNSLDDLKKVDIVDAPCGCREADGYGALFEPWLGRYLQSIDCNIIGLDTGRQYEVLDKNLQKYVLGEKFPIYLTNLGVQEFPLKSNSVNLIHVSQLFDSPSLEYFCEFETNREIMNHIESEAKRILKPEGVLLVNGYFDN